MTWPKSRELHRDLHRWTMPHEIDRIQWCDVISCQRSFFTINKCDVNGFIIFRSIPKDNMLLNTHTHTHTHTRLRQYCLTLVELLHMHYDWRQDSSPVARILIHDCLQLLIDHLEITWEITHEGICRCSYCQSNENRDSIIYLSIAPVKEESRESVHIHHEISSLIEWIMRD
jgi:hypothetical protein